jgi:hypothetical protein
VSIDAMRGLDAAEDLPSAPQEMPLWCENFMFCAYDPATSAGFYAHLGTMPDDPALWRGTFCGMLPDGRILAGKDYGRGGTAAGPASPALSFTCEEPFTRWRLTRRDVAMPTSLQELAGGLLCDRAPVAVELDVVFTASAPAWKMGGAHSNVFHRHYEQGGRVQGTLRAGDQIFAIDTMGYRDHSVGPRDVSHLLSHTLVYASFPSGRVVQGFTMAGPGGASQSDAYVVREGIEPAQIVSLPSWDGTGNGDAGEFAVKLMTADGPVDAIGHTLAGTYYTFEAPNELLFGRAPDSVGHNIATVTPASFSWDGETGVGMLELSYRPGVTAS